MRWIGLDREKQSYRNVSDTRSSWSGGFGIYVVHVDRDYPQIQLVCVLNRAFKVDIDNGAMLTENKLEV